MLPKHVLSRKQALLMIEGKLSLIIFMTCFHVEDVLMAYIPISEVLLLTSTETLRTKMNGGELHVPKLDGWNRNKLPVKVIFIRNFLFVRSGHETMHQDCICSEPADVQPVVPA